MVRRRPGAFARRAWHAGLDHHQLCRHQAVVQHPQRARLPATDHLNLVDGPFSALKGTWEFKALGENACKVLYTMEYAFSSRALEAVVGPVFNRIASSFIDSFTQRAQSCYG